LPALVLATNVFRVYIREAYRNVRIALAKINAYLQECITGMSVIQLFGREERNSQHFDQLNRDYYQAMQQSILYHGLFFPTVELLAAVAMALVLWYGGGQILQGIVTLGVLAAFLQYVQRFFQPLRDLSEKFNIMQAAMASAERIFDLLGTPEEVRDKPGAQPVKQFQGEVEFKNVWFAYSGQDWVLKEVSFHIAPGESVAIVGATGAGKTSVINLINRFYDVQRGQVLVDGIDVRDYQQRSLRARIGLVLQDVFLFSGTIESNLRLGNQDIPVEALVQAAQYVNAHQFIQRLPQGYQTPVVERGATLSVGQRQLLAFARALVANPEILLVMDEATSSVDTETELLIQDALAKLMKGRTSIIIAHRLSTIKSVDRIIVLHKGEIKELGTHAELLARGGFYYRLYQLQYQDQETASPAQFIAPSTIRAR
ncbi:MAG: ABC transporter ATP-binding protein, partial [Deinococcus sp.]|nr:ABC transporter ATP-binding protein [Deinococcus sp.]